MYLVCGVKSNLGLAQFTVLLNTHLLLRLCLLIIRCQWHSNSDTHYVIDWLIWYISHMSLVKKDVFWTFDTELKYLNHFKPSPVCWLLFTCIRRLHNTPCSSPIIGSTLLVYILLLGPAWCWLVSRGLKVTTQTISWSRCYTSNAHIQISLEFLDPGMTRFQW